MVKALYDDPSVFRPKTHKQAVEWVRELVKRELVPVRSGESVLNAGWVDGWNTYTRLSDEQRLRGLIRDMEFLIKLKKNKGAHRAHTKHIIMPPILNLNVYRWELHCYGCGKPFFSGAISKMYCCPRCKYGG
jgi:hypothetical protein